MIAAWYRREDYERVRDIMEDGDQFPATYEEWENRAKLVMADAKARGNPVRLIEVDLDEFVAYCREEVIPQGAEARMQYTLAKGATQRWH